MAQGMGGEVSAKICNGPSANTFANSTQAGKNISPDREGQETAGIGRWKSGTFIL